MDKVSGPVRNLVRGDFHEAIATVRLHQKNPIVSQDNMIDISIGECEVSSFVERLRSQIYKVTIEFKPHHLKSTMHVDIYFKDSKGIKEIK